MKKALLVLSVFLSMVVGFLAAVVASVWIFPGAFVSVADRALAPHGVRLAVRHVRGTPGAGWIVDGLVVHGPGFDIAVHRLRVDIDWESTFMGRPAFNALWIEGARVRLRPLPAAKPPAASTKSSGPPALLPIHSLRLADADVTWEPNDEKPFQVGDIALEARLTSGRAEVAALAATVRGNRIEARGHYEPAARTGAVEARVRGFLVAPGLPERTVGPVSLTATMNGNEITLQRLFAVVEQSTVAAEGRVRLAPMDVWLHAESRGPLEIRADVRGDASRWRASAVGVQKTSRFTAIASYGMATKTWKTTASAAGIPAALIPGLPPALGALSADLSASGRGTTPATLDGKGHLALAATNGPHLAADLALDQGSAQATVVISSGGVNGRVAGRWQLARARGSGSADLTLGPALHAWLPLSAEGPVHLDVSGPQKKLAWNLSAQLQKISVDDFFVDQLSMTGRGSALAPPAGRLTVAVAGVDAGREKMEKASLTVDGTLTRHAFELALDRQGASLRAAGRGRLVRGRWSSTWTRLDTDLGQPWSLSAPFDLTAGPGSVSIRGLRLTSSAGGALSVDGGFSKGDIRDLRLSAHGLRLDGLRKLAGLDLAIDGTASAEVTASGPLARPVAQVKGRLSGLSVDRRPAGDVDLSAHLTGGRAAIERLSLVSPGGTLAFSGDVPLSWSGRKTPAFRIRVQTAGLDPAALPVPLGDWTVEGGRLKADLTVSGQGRTFSAVGPLDFTASRVAEGDKKTGTELKDVRIRLAGDGASLRVAEATAKGGDGTATLTGRVAATHADLSLAARGFEYRHPSGVYAKFNADLSLRGAWDAPRLTGRVDIVKGSVEPVNEKKEKKTEAAKKEKPPAPRPVASPAPSSPMSADVAVAFPNNVWYRDGQTAIEMKGDLSVRKESGAPWLVFGTVETLRGDYFFYGRAFSISQGRLTFTGEEPPNPRLELTAVNQNQANNVTVTITGSGTLRDPRIALSSEPPMDETDIIAVLVTGSPMGADHQSAGGEAMARSVAANYLAEKVRQRVQNKVRLDVLQLHLGENGQKGDVTIGERVSKNLFLSYGQTLESDAERRVNAEYVLTPRFSLQGQTTNIGRYVLDLLFKFGFY